jgi:hypothetical protein
MGWMFDIVGRLIGWLLQKQAESCEPLCPDDLTALRDTLRPGDVLLVDGKHHISSLIKYLSQSTWSHSALYVGPIAGVTTPEGEPHVLIEANSGEGVVSAQLSKYEHCHTRICRPEGLSEARLRRCEPHHLFFPDCASIRSRALPDPAHDHARREPGSAVRNRRDPSLVALRAARLRHFALLHGGEAHAGARLQL